jgi:hypothetical protein
MLKKDTKREEWQLLSNKEIKNNEHTTRNIANGGKIGVRSFAARIRVRSGRIGTHSANRHLPYCQTL